MTRIAETDYESLRERCLLALDRAMLLVSTTRVDETWLLNIARQCEALQEERNDA